MLGAGPPTLLIKNVGVTGAYRMWGGSPRRFGRCMPPPVPLAFDAPFILRWRWGFRPTGVRESNSGPP